ncbi:MAG: hypothetical protein IT317_09220 [Anaerolineales bacterium]|nr:hypothetical protein [Anaerolineales bacterium]
MTRRRIAWLAGLVVAGVFALAACATVTATPSTATATPEPIPTPEPGLVTVAGRLVNTATQAPYANQVIRLAEVIHIDPGDSGTWMIDDATSPGDYTNDQGYFVIANVAAKEYVLVVGDFHVSYAVVTDTPDNAAVWQPEADRVLDVGQVDVVLP